MHTVDFVHEIIDRALHPDPTLTVSQWADEHRYLSSISSSEPGLWRTSRTPYLGEIMDCLSVRHSSEQVVFMKGAQIGGTEAGNNWIGYIIHHVPAPMLIVFPTAETAKRHSKTRLDPLIESSPALMERISPARSRDSGNTMMMKEFPGGVMILTGANSGVGLRSMPIRYLFMDEVDGYPDDADNEGDPASLAIQRTATFSNRKIFMVSTPTIKNYSRIEAAYLEGDQREYYVPCPDCSELQTLKWSQVKWDKEHEEDAYYVCEYCGSIWHDGLKTKLLDKGQWRAKYPNKNNGKTVSFKLSSLYSPHGWTSWGQIAKEFKEVYKDPPRLQVWTNTKLAESWEDMSGEAIDPTGLLARCEDYSKYLPANICILTAGVDVQDNRLEIEIVGWGRDEESWNVDYLTLYGDPSTPHLWEDLDNVLNAQYKHARQIPDMGISGVCISGIRFQESEVRLILGIAKLS